MNLSILFRNWWMILIQGILMIVLSIIIFNNPGPVLAAIAFWLGIVMLISGLIGVIAWFANSKEQGDFPAMFGSLMMVMIGILMISKLLITIKAITFVFGLLSIILGLVIISASWNGRAKWSLWWLIALFGAGAIVMGVKSIKDVAAGAENISTLIGVSVLLSGIGLILLAFMKKKLVDIISKRVNDLKSEINKTIAL